MQTIEELGEKVRKSRRWRDPVETLRKSRETPVEKYDPRQPRDPHSGEWVEVPGLSVPEFFVPEGSDIAAGLPVLPWTEPPAPQGQPGGSRGGFSASGATVTAAGELAEAIARRFGLDRAQAARQGALDAIADGWGYEIKGRSVLSTGYRVGMRTADMLKKRKVAEELGLKPGLIMVITHEPQGRAWVYHRAGIFNGKLVKGKFVFAGAVKL